MPNICATRSPSCATNYGRIDILWLDFSYSQRHARRRQGMVGAARARMTGKPEELIAHRPEACSPHIIIDNRAELEQDLWTPEQFQPTTGSAIQRPASW